MGLTLVEKLLGLKAGRPVRPGEFVELPVDLALANDVTAPLAIEAFGRMGAGRVFAPERVVFVLDHFVPCRDVRSAQQCALVRRFARQQGVRLYEEGEAGIEHVLVPEEGLVSPGDLVVGADSHTCTYGALGAMATGVGSTDLAYAMATGRVWLRVPETIRLEFVGELPPFVEGKDLILWAISELGVHGATYRALEFGGDAAGRLPLYQRFTMANMAVEAGAKCGLFEVDEEVLTFLEGRVHGRPAGLTPDPDAVYREVRRFDVSGLRPLVALPPSPARVRPAEEVRERIDQVVIGSCTNGRIEDLRTAADILRGRRVARGVRLLVFPGSPRVLRQAVREGLVEVFLEAGAVVCPPTCGPCLGGHLGVLAEGERAVATTNRNFVGRMGHPRSEVYLSGVAVAAASALLGRIATPQEVVS